MLEIAMKLIDISTRKYPNTFAKVDDEDYEWLNSFTWHLSGNGYARRTEILDNGKRRVVRMHRSIVVCAPEMQIDHINGDRLDNTRANLRVCTVKQNACNRKKRPGMTSEFKGVNYEASRNSWGAFIWKSGRKVRIGRFKNEMEAAMAYNEEAKKEHGDFAVLNDVGTRALLAAAPSREVQNALDWVERGKYSSTFPNAMHLGMGWGDDYDARAASILAQYIRASLPNGPKAEGEGA